MTSRQYTTTPAIHRCNECSFTTGDIHLMVNHSCDIEQNGGNCEDFPACGHEWGDCNGLRYGSDEAIKEDAMKHIDCEHEHGICNAEEDEPDDYDDGVTDDYGRPI